MVKYNKKEKLCKKKRKDKVKPDFSKWMKKVDRRVFKKLNMHLSDLPDEDFWINWSNGIEYKIMASKIVMDQNDFVEFLLE
jgi:hypothetical protein